jgi:peptidyl-prolyl cis-trans isomerase C
MRLRHPFDVLLSILAAVVLTPTLVIGLSYLVATRVTALPDGAALRVGDTVVTEAGLRERLELLRALYGIQAPPDPAQADAFRRESARAVAISVMFDQAARDEGVVVDDQAVRQGLDALLQARYPGGRADFVAMLGTVGASEQDVLDEIRRQKATAALYAKVVAGRQAEVTVSPEETRRYFEQNPAAFVQPEKRHLRTIVVSSEAQANQVAEQARAGADFGQLARQYSRDDSTRDSGGDLGGVTRDRLDDAFGAAAFGTAPGGTFGPVRVRDDWNVGQVLEVQPAVPLRFEMIAEALRLDLQKQKAGQVWRDWVEERVRSAGIEYAEPYRPAEPDPLAPAAPAPGAAGADAQEGPH